MITIPETISRHVLFIGGKEYGVFTYKSSKEDFLKYSFNLSKKEKEDILSGRVSFEFKENVLNISEQEKDILERLHKHGVEKYNHHGWDYLVECWDTYEKVLEMREKQLTNIDEAIDYYKYICKALDDKRREYQPEFY